MIFLVCSHALASWRDCDYSSCAHACVFGRENDDSVPMSANLGRSFGLIFLKWNTVHYTPLSLSPLYHTHSLTRTSRRQQLLKCCAWAHFAILGSLLLPSALSTLHRTLPSNQNLRTVPLSQGPVFVFKMTSPNTRNEETTSRAALRIRKWIRKRK